MSRLLQTVIFNVDRTQDLLLFLLQAVVSVLALTGFPSFQSGYLKRFPPITFLEKSKRVGIILLLNLSSNIGLNRNDSTFIIHSIN